MHTHAHTAPLPTHAHACIHHPLRTHMHHAHTGTHRPIAHMCTHMHTCAHRHTLPHCLHMHTCAHRQCSPVAHLTAMKPDFRCESQASEGSWDPRLREDDGAWGHLLSGRHREEVSQAEVWSPFSGCLGRSEHQPPPGVLPTWHVPHPACSPPACSPPSVFPPACTLCRGSCTNTAPHAVTSCVHAPVPSVRTAVPVSASVPTDMLAGWG